MKVWILFSFLALAIAKEDKDRSENLNDIGTPYDVNNFGGFPIFPFDAFNIGYKNFFGKYPPWLSAINREEIERESVSSSTTDKDNKEELPENSSPLVSEVELLGEPESFSGSVSKSKSVESASVSIPEVSISISSFGKSQSSSESYSLSEVSESQSSVTSSVSSSSASSVSSSSASSASSRSTSSVSSSSASSVSSSSTSSVSSSSASISSSSLPVSTSVSSSASEKSPSMSVTASAPSASEYEVQIPAPISSQTVEKYQSGMGVDRVASTMENEKLKVDDVRKALEKSYTNLGQLKKKLFKRQNVISDLTEVIRDLEILCERICQVVPPKYLLSTEKMIF